MPIETIDVTPTTDRAANFAGTLSEGGVLESLSTRLHVGTTAPGRVLVQAGVFKHTPSEANTVVVLIDDYVYAGHSPSWTGKIHLEPGEGVYANVRAADAVTIRTIGHVLRRDP